MVYYHKATIKGHGAFPLDMLRYDSCSPERQQDVTAMRNEEFEGFSVQVAAISDRKEHWTVARWESFGCKVVSINRRKY